MDKNKIIIGVLIVVIIALLIGIFAVMPNLESKHDTNLTFKCKSTVTEGDSIKVKLTDANGTAIANQTVNVTIEDKDKFSDYHSVVTNDKGVGKVKMDKNPGKYVITISYSGDDKYNGCNATKKITIEEEVVEAEPTSSSSSSSDYDSGAFYSRQSGRTIYTGEVMDTPGGKMRHLGNNEWEPAE